MAGLLETYLDTEIETVRSTGKSAPRKLEVESFDQDGKVNVQRREFPTTRPSVTPPISGRVRPVRSVRPCR